MNTSRFVCPSLGLDLRGLVSKAQKPLWITFGLAVVLHLALTQISGWREEESVAKPLTTQFVKRQPRLTKPLELKKRPRPKRRQMHREMISVRAQVRREQASSAIRPLTGLGQLARPDVHVSRAVGFQAADMEPQAVAQMIEGEKEARNRVDMSLEMLDVKAMDTGRYHAMVIQDPTDKRNIKGFFRLKYAYSENMQKRSFGSWEDYNMGALVALVQAVNRYTDIETRLEGRILFTSREMMKTPWVYSCVSWPFMLPEQEAALLGRYLMSGGFMLWDSWNHFMKGPGPVGDQKRPAMCISSTRTNLKAAMATQRLEYGRDWTFEILSNDHPLYHCYFDFDGAPACIYDPLFVLEGKLEGICVDGRWMAVSCQKVFMQLWGYHYPQFRSERMLQFGVNTVIFALTQEGSITHRVMDAVR